MKQERQIQVKALTRVEGEGGLYVRLVGERIEDVQLRIFEPPRLFEALLRGRAVTEVPDIVARICGICPVAYQMSAVHALEQALGIVATPELRRLRRLLYCGEWIESHALHVYMLHAPDFLGYDGGLSMAADHRAAVERGLRMKKIGNRLLEVLGGRAIHPINVAVGGFYRLPRREELQALIPDFQWGLDAAVETARWVASFPFPDFEQPYDFTALVHPDEYALCEGRIASSAGPDVAVADYEREFAERQVAHSTALQSIRTATQASYFVGPLARVNLSFDRLSPTARRTADEIGFAPPCRNPFRSIIARALELVHVFEEALGIVRDYRPTPPPRVAYRPRDGEGCAATEAPRGILYHRYRIGADGLVHEAKIVPPTSQNQTRIEDDLRGYLPQLLPAGDAAATVGCERLVRSYDPCISCATHFLRLHVERT